MRILVACEFSGIVRDAFIRRGHDAVSCDLLNVAGVCRHHGKEQETEAAPSAESRKRWPIKWSDCDGEKQLRLDLKDVPIRGAA